MKRRMFKSAAYFANGGFTLIFDGLQAWYAPDGTLLDAEEKVQCAGGLIAARSVSARCRNVRDWLAQRGAAEVRDPAHAQRVADCVRAFETRMAALPT